MSINNLSSIYGLVPVGWVERSSKGCRYSSNRTLLFSRQVLKICQVKPNALRHLQLWIVGFRYIYFLQRFMAHQSCVQSLRVLGLLPLYPTYVDTSVSIIELTLNRLTSLLKNIRTDNQQPIANCHFFRNIKTDSRQPIADSQEKKLLFSPVYSILYTIDFLKTRFQQQRVSFFFLDNV